MASSLLQDSMPSPPPADTTSRFRPYSSPAHTVTRGRYITSNDPRGYIPVYEYPLNGQWLMVDSDNGYVLWTGIWKALGNSKADIVKMLESQPELAPQLRRVRGGYLKIQGTWMPYEIALRLARRVAWPIREDLVPLFGPTFPSTCLSPDQPGYGQLVNNPGRRKSRRITGASQQQRPRSPAGGSQHPQPPPPHVMLYPHAQQQFQGPEYYQQQHLPMPSSDPNEHGLALLSSAAVSGVQVHDYGPSDTVSQMQIPAESSSSLYSSRHPHEHQFLGSQSDYMRPLYVPSQTQVRPAYTFPPVPEPTSPTHLSVSTSVPHAHDYPHSPLRERGGLKHQQRYTPYPSAGPAPRFSPPPFSTPVDPTHRSADLNLGRAMVNSLPPTGSSTQDVPILLPPLSSLGPPPPRQASPSGGPMSAGASSGYSLPPISSLDSPASGGSAPPTDSSAVLRRLKLDDEHLYKSDVQSEADFRMPTAEELQRRRSLSAPPLHGIGGTSTGNLMSYMPLAWQGEPERRQVYSSHGRTNSAHQYDYAHSYAPPRHQHRHSGFSTMYPPPQLQRPPMPHPGPGMHISPVPSYSSYREQSPAEPSPLTPATPWSAESTRVGSTLPSGAGDASRFDEHATQHVSTVPEWPQGQSTTVHPYQDSGAAGDDDPHLSACRDSTFDVDLAPIGLGTDGAAVVRMPSRPPW